MVCEVRKLSRYSQFPSRHFHAGHPEDKCIYTFLPNHYLYTCNRFYYTNFHNLILPKVMDIKCQQQVSLFRCQCLRSERSAPVPHSFFSSPSRNFCRYVLMICGTVLFCTCKIFLTGLGGIDMRSSF